MAGSRAGGHRRPRRLPSSTAIAAVLTGAGAFAVYWTTLLRDVAPWDTGEAQAVLPLMGTMHPTGFPAYVLIGWLASVVLQPLGEPAFRVNVLSALLAASAAGTTVVILRRLAVPLPLAVGAAAGFALSPATWWIGSAADAHALHVALVTLIVLALVRWEALVRRRHEPAGTAVARRADRALLLAAALFGVSLANHALTLLLVPSVALYVVAVDRAVLRRPGLVLAALGTTLGIAALLYLELPLRAGLFRAPLVYGAPATWDGFWQVVLARQFQGDFTGTLAHPLDTIRLLADSGGLQLGVLLLLLLPAFAATAVRAPRYALLSGTATLVTCLFAASYVNAAIWRYYLVPVLFAWTWLGVGAAWVVDRVGTRSTPGPWTVGRFQPRMRTLVATAFALALLVPTAVDLYPRWRAADRSGETATRAWLDNVLATVPPDSVIVSWWSYSTPVWYGQLVDGRRPDITLIDDRTRLDQHLGDVTDVIDSYLGMRPVYVIRATGSDLQDVAARYTLELFDSRTWMFQVTDRQETTR